MKTSKYSKSELIDILKEWVDRNGFVPSKRQLNDDKSMPSDMTYRKAFGSWGGAMLACGYEIKKPFPSENCKKAVSIAKKGKIRDKSSHWKGGVIETKYGYMMIYNSEKQKYEREHRVVMEKYIGRSLLEYEDVHHINGIKSDNRIENLEILTRSEHAKEHGKNGKNHARKKRSKCEYPGCEIETASKYNLCKKHYKLQWQRLKKGIIKALNDYEVPERKHSDETKNKLSDIAKKQNRKNGRFAK